MPPQNAPQKPLCSSGGSTSVTRLRSRPSAKKTPRMSITSIAKEAARSVNAMTWNATTAARSRSMGKKYERSTPTHREASGRCRGPSQGQDGPLCALPRGPESRLRLVGVDRAEHGREDRARDGDARRGHPEDLQSSRPGRGHSQAPSSRRRTKRPRGPDGKASGGICPAIRSVRYGAAMPSACAGPSWGNGSTRSLRILPTWSAQTAERKANVQAIRNANSRRITHERALSVVLSAPWASAANPRRLPAVPHGNSLGSRDLPGPLLRLRRTPAPRDPLPSGGLAEPP